MLLEKCEHCVNPGTTACEDHDILRHNRAPILLVVVICNGFTKHRMPPGLGIEAVLPCDLYAARQRRTIELVQRCGERESLRPWMSPFSSHECSEAVSEG